jgi:hypothetical protein
MVKITERSAYCIKNNLSLFTPQHVLCVNKDIDSLILHHSLTLNRIIWLPYVVTTFPSSKKIIKGVKNPSSLLFA